jgi:predicted rRNA methylase YqxC with S4 and FtsJ domains
MLYSNPKKEHLFLDVSFTSIDTLVPSLYQCVETRRNRLIVVSAISKPSFQALRHQRNVCHPVVNSFTRQTLLNVHTKHFFVTESFCPQRLTTVLCSSVVHSSSMVAFLTTEIAFEHAQAHVMKLGCAVT